jgi:very-short-patch-repair endonuclease
MAFRTHQAPDAEQALWTALRRAFPAARFRRKVPHGPYRVDFMSDAGKLAVAVDGAPEPDSDRTRYLAAQGYWLLRVRKDEVSGRLDDVLEAIAETLPVSSSAAAQRRIME